MQKQKRLGLLAKQKAAGWGFLMPAALLIFIMSFYPMVQAFIKIGRASCRERV